jgi:hypothetical protein
MAITIHPDLQSLIPPLRPEERAQLEANIVAYGCHDPLIIWQEEQILLDGHNRYAICTQHSLDYGLHEVSLPDWDSAQLWILRHQRGRRNSTPNQLSYMRGKEYEIQRRQGKRTDLTSGKSYQKLPSTATAVGQEHQVSEKTIRNDFAYAKALDTLAETVGKEVRDKVRDHDLKLTQTEVRALAAMAPRYSYAVKGAIAAVQEVKTPKQARHIVRQTVREAREHDAEMDARFRSECARDLGLIPPPPAPVLVLEPEDVAVDEMPAPATQTEVLAPECPAPSPTPPEVQAPAPPEAAAPPQSLASLVDALRIAWEAGDGKQLDTLMDMLQDREDLKTVRYFPDDHTSLYFAIAAWYWKEMADASLAAINTVVDRLSALGTYEAGEAEQQDYVAWLRDKGDTEAAPWETDPAWFDNPDIIGFVHDTLETTPHYLAQVRQYCATLAPPAPAPAPEVEGAEVKARLRDQVGLQQAVWLTVQELQPCTNAQVKEALGEQRGVTFQALTALVKHGRITKEGETYRVVDTCK